MKIVNKLMFKIDNKLMFKIDNKLMFNAEIDEICEKKAVQVFIALSQIQHPWNYPRD